MPAGEPQVPNGLRFPTIAFSGTGSHIPTGPRFPTIAFSGTHVPSGPRAPTIAFSGTHVGHVYRGGYSRSRGRGGGAAYHPYQRPQQFRNQSVAFNNQDLAGDTSESERAAPLTTNGTYMNYGPHQHTEPQTPCRQFTMTGTERESEQDRRQSMHASNL